MQEQVTIACVSRGPVLEQVTIACVSIEQVTFFLTQFLCQLSHMYPENPEGTRRDPK